MRFFVGVTDSSWFSQLRQLQPDEVNFWRPSGAASFKAISVGEPYLFKLHGTPHRVAGGGFLVTYSVLPASLAWEAFGQKNGTKSLSDLVGRVRKYSKNALPDPLIGCTILTQPFFLSEEEYVEIPGWQNAIVQGKSYDSTQGEGAYLWDMVAKTATFNRATQLVEAERYDLRIVQQRIGQGAFRVLVTDAYHKRCAATGEKTLPVLQAAHIKPYGSGGLHSLQNGLLLRADLHILFDRGYLTITPDLKVEVSQRIKEEFTNGRDYYKLHGSELVNLPENPAQRPSKELLTWHNENIYQQPLVQL